MTAQAIEQNECKDVLEEALWRNDSNRLTLARKDAQKMKEAGMTFESHVLMLRTYLMILTQLPTWYKKFTYTILGIWHMRKILPQRQYLKPIELDSMVQFCLIVAKPFRLNFLPRASINSLRLYAGVALNALKKEGSPHELALAYMTIAEASYLNPRYVKDVYSYVNQALALRVHIENEKPQRYVLRRLVCVLRRAGEMLLQPALFNSRQEVRALLEQAKKLAESSADARSELPRINALLRAIPHVLDPIAK